MLGNGVTLSLLYVICCVIQLSAAQCDGGPPLTLSEQGAREFTTPNFPDGRYPSNARCSWLLQVTSGTIELNFPDFNLPYEVVFGSAACGVTKVDVYDGPTTSSPLLGTYCEKTPPPAVTSSSGISMLVAFTGGLFSSRGQGFRATFTVIGGDTVATTTPLPDSTTTVPMTPPSLFTTIPPTTSASTTTPSTSSPIHPSTPLTETSEAPIATTTVPESTAIPALTTTVLKTTTPEPSDAASTTRPRYDQTSDASKTSEGPTTPVLQTTTAPESDTTVPTTSPLQSTADSSTATRTTQQADTTLPHAITTQPHSTTLQQPDTTTPTSTNSSPHTNTVLSTTIPETSSSSTSSSPQDTTEEMTPLPSQTIFAVSPIGVVTATETTSDNLKTSQPFNVSTVFVSTTDIVPETTRQATKSTRLPDMKPVTTGKPGSNGQHHGNGGLTEGQILMFAAIGGAVAGLLFVGMVGAVCFCRGQRQGSYAIGFQELGTLNGGFGHAVNNPVYDRSDADDHDRDNPAQLDSCRLDSAYQSLQGSRASSVDSQQDLEMDVKL